MPQAQKIAVTIQALCALFIFGAIYAGYSLLVHRTERRIAEIATQGSLERDLLAQTLAERGEMLGRARLHVERGIVASQRAQKLTDEVARKKLLCEGLSHFGKALKSEPRNSRYLINWANLRQTLGGSSCEEDYTSGNFMDAVTLALAESPTSPEILYAASLVQYWSGDNKRSRDTLRRVLQLGTKITDSQTSFILSMINTPEDFEAIVPFRFPQVGTWISYLKGRKAEGFDKVFSKAMLLALDEAVNEFKKGSIALQYHIARLHQVYDLDMGDSVRRVVDVIVRDLLSSKGDNVSAEYFSARSGLEEINIVRGIYFNDIRPYKTPLVDWGFNSKVFLDAYHQSIGFFLPEGNRVSIIELTPSIETSEIEPTSVKVYVSDDNQRWTELPGAHPKLNVRFGKMRIANIRTQGVQARYWKLTFDKDERIRRFGNDLRDLIRVYGARYE